MKPRVYVLVLLMLIPVQASLLAPLVRVGLRPDLGLALLYTVGLLTGPGEAALAGIGIGLLLDLGSASLIGFSGLTYGIVGLCAGLLGRRVLDVQSRSNVIFIALFSLLESLLAAIFLEMIYGSFPVLSQVFRRMVPQAVLTAAAGFLILRYATRREVLVWILRRDLQREL
jgi:rod shape-determining protein MreD